jgi:UDP-N-acetylmuramate dehydrogenase
MKISHLPIAALLRELEVDLRPDDSLTGLTSLGIGGTTDRLVIKRRENFAEVIRLVEEAGVPYKLLGGGTNLLVTDGELPWVVVQLAAARPSVRIEGDAALADAAADLGATVTFCAKNDLGGMEGLIGVPGTVGGALRMNAGAYGTQIGSFVREVELYRHAARSLETVRGSEISFDYRHTSFAPEDVMLHVRLELPRMPYREIVARIQTCNQKRRASQPLNQKSAGCIFKNPPGLSAGRMIDELGLKSFSVGDAAVSDRHANFFINRGHASFADMMALIETVRERVFRSCSVELENEVILWRN